jgi:thiol-disulfide isomerase/thioredoxin
MRLLAAVVLTLASAAAAADPAPLPAPLAAYSGKLVYLDFWASWCGPCAQSFPWLNRMQARYKDALVVVGVNVDTDAKAADAFLQRHPASFDIVRDPAGTLPEHYAIAGMPSSVLIAPDGRVLHQHAGFRSHETDKYEAAIRDALASAQVHP